jgi:putative hydrolase of the HAD superfamily
MYMNRKEHRLIEILKQNSTPLSPLPTLARPHLPSNIAIRAVLFDIYGTLFISASGDVGTVTKQTRADAMQEALNRCNIKVTTPTAGQRGTDLFTTSIAEEHKALRKNGTDFPEVDIRDIWNRVVQGLYQEGLIATPPDRVPTEELAVVYETLVNPVWPMPGVEETILRCAEETEVLGIVSNAQFFTPLLFPAFFHKAYSELGFDDSLTLFSYTLKQAKPSMHLFEKAARELADTYNISPSHVLYVGNDMLNDIYPAACAGFSTALFAGDKRSLRLRENDDRCRDMKPDATITTLAQIIQLIEPHTMMEVK